MIFFSFDPFARKDWYRVEAPTTFHTCYIGKTLVNRKQPGVNGASMWLFSSNFHNKKLCAGSGPEGLVGRIFELYVDDMQNKNQRQGIHGSCLFSFRKFKLIAETVVGRRVLCNFHGMELASEKLRNCVRKGQLSYFKYIYTNFGFLLKPCI